MEIKLQQVIPIPLKEKILLKNSDVWNKEICFNEKEWVKIRAASGTGKTTLIHFLYKLRTDYEGKIFYDNQSLSQIKNNSLAEFRQQKISIIFQDLRLFYNLTALENIQLNRVLQDALYTEERIFEMAEQLGITHILHQPARLCSYGEQQRVCIIRALIQPFKILLMDEPFSHLDIANTAIAAKLIADECKKQNAGFVLTDLDDDEHFNYSKLLNL